MRTFNRKPRFAIGQSVHYLGIGLKGIIKSAFWADAPDSPNDEHFRYYVQTKKGTYSVPESKLVFFGEKTSKVSSPVFATLPVAASEADREGGASIPDKNCPTEAFVHGNVLDEV